MSSWYIDPVNGSDNNDGATPATALRTNAGFMTRMTGGIASIWEVQSNTAVYYLSYPPDNDPLYLDIDLRVRGDGSNSSPSVDVYYQVDFYAPSLSVASSGTFSDVTTRTRSTNTPYMVADGSVDTSGDVGRRILIPSGPRAGATAWVALAPAAGQRRTSEWVQWTTATLTEPVTPEIGDPYEVLESSGALHLGRINILPTTGSSTDSAFPSSALSFHGFDFHPANDDSMIPIFNGGAILVFDNCSFNNGEYAFITLILSGDNTSTLTYLPNCSTGMTGAANLWVMSGDFTTNIIEAGLYSGAVAALQGAGLTIDFDTLLQANSSVPLLGAESGGTLRVVTCGIMDVHFQAGVVVGHDAVVWAFGESDSGYTPQIWGTTSVDGIFGMLVLSGGSFRYVPGTLMTVTGPAGDFALDGNTNARAWDDTAGAYTANIACTWANLIGGSLLDNAHNLMANARAYKSAT
jgi:hypothetical protein